MPNNPVEGSARSQVSRETRDKINDYQSGWDRENTRKIGLKLNRRTDADIIAAAEADPSGLQGFFKSAAREKIARDAAGKEE